VYRLYCLSHIDRKRVLKWILREMKWEVVDWICLAEDIDQWLAFVNIVLNLVVCLKSMEFLD
jgi:hypothetical protein